MARVGIIDPRTDAVNEARHNLEQMLRGLVGLPSQDLVKLIEIFIETKMEARR